MRIRYGAALALATTAWMVTPLTPAHADPEKASGDCTIVGTPGPDVLRGTNHDDFICGLGGDDKISGRGGDDVLQGGGGDDLLVGGSGDDVLGGGRGDDTLNGLDNATAVDRLRCGRGEDTAKADAPDIPRPRCEHVEQPEAPTGLSLAPSSVAENQPGGTAVGALGAADPDPGDTHIFTLVAGTGSADNGSFTIVGASLRTAVSLDFETTPTRTVRIRATDSAGLSVERAFTITVTDADDSPVAVDDTKTVVEDDPATAINVLANDTDTDGGPKTITAVTQPTNGTVVITGGGSGLTYAPAANYCNTPTPPFDAFTYTLNGGDVGAVDVTVTCADDNPVAVNDSTTVTEDAAATAVAVLTNDTDVDAGPKSIQSVTQPANGTVVITGGGTGLTYAPDAGYCNAPPGTTPDTFNYTLAPGGSTATVSVTVTCVDDAPTAVNDSATVAEDAATAPVPVLTNDTDTDGGPKTISSVTQPANGTVAIIGGGAGLTYAPNANYCNAPPGTTLDTFTYTLNGGSTASVSMTVTCADDAPVAVDDTKTVSEDDATSAVNVLANDTDVDGGPISISSVTQPANGTVVITGGGTGLSYAPNANYCNSPPPFDTFTYTLTPGGSTATVSVTVTCGDDPPAAVNDAATVTEDSGATAVGVLANDTDADGGPKSIASVTQPANGTVVITGGGTGLTYAPDANYCNSPPPSDTFTYTLSPGGSIATVSMTVTCVDDNPVAVNDAATVVLNAAATAVPVLANDTDVDGGPKSISSVTQPANGTVVITGGGTGLTYQPNAGYCNDALPLDTFTYTLNGGSSATVTMTVTCDIAPTAVNDSATVAEDAAAAAVSVLGNDTDPDGGPKSIASVTQPANGTVVITGGGTGLTYQPDANYCNDPPGTTLDTFTYTLTPGGSTATVSMTVTCVDDAPVAVNDAATVLEDAAATVVTVLANDTDIDGGPKSITSVTQPANGTVVVTGGGTGLTYQPSANYCNAPPGTTPDTFTYTLTPGGSAATVSMTVTCVNDAPSAVADSFEAISNTGLFVGTTRPATQAGKEITGSVLSNDTDGDSPPGNLVVEPVTNAPTTLGGTITIEADGNFTYQPDDGDVGVADTFTYRVCDASPCNSGTDANSTGTLSLPLTGQVWYVRNNEPAGGDGTSDTPFDTLAEAEAASGTGDTVFVFDGSNTTTNLDTGYAMNAGERLIGESRPLSLDPDAGGPLPTSPLFPGTSGSQPTLTASNEDVVVLASNVLVDGVDLDPAGTGGGISGGAGTADVTVQNVNVTDTGSFGTQPGIEMDGTTGVNRFTGVTVTNGGSATAIGVRINNADRVLFTSTATNTIATSGAKALDVATTNLLTSRWNDITVTGSGTGAIRLNSTTGQPVLGDGAGTDLSLQTTSGSTAALDIASSNTVTVDSAGTDTVSATGGPALDIRSSNGSQFFFDSASSTNSAGDGVNLDSNLTAPVVVNAGTIAGAAGIAFDVNGGGTGAGGVTYDGAISDGPGQSVEVTGRDGGAVTLSGNITDSPDAGGGIVVSANTGGSTTFSGASKVINSGAGNGVAMTTSDGHTLSFTGGGLDLDATSGRGLRADASGTITVTGSGNTVDTTTGIALDVTNTDIGNNDLTFQRVASNGAASGVVLNTTGNANGGLVVTGNGGTCSSAATCTGGAIQASTGPGLNLTSAPGGVSLTRVAVTAGGDDGIRATTVNDIDLADSVVLNNGNNHTGGLEERGLDYLNVTGTPDILRTVVSGSDDSNAHIRNTVAGTTTLGVNNSTFSDSKFNAGLRLRGEGPSVMNATVQNSTFSLNADPGFSMSTDASNTAQQTLLLTANSFSGGSSNAVSGRPQVSINSDSGSVVKATISNNLVKSAAGAEIIVNSLASQTAAGSLDARVIGNTINDAQPGVLDALADGGTSIWGWAHGDGATRIEVRNNVVANYGGRALELSHNDGNGTADFTVTGNTFSTPDLTPNTFEGMYVLSGGAGGDTSNVCVDLENNDFDGIGRQSVSDLAIDRFNGTILRFADFNDTSVPNLQTNLRGKNPASPTLTVETFSNGPTATAATSCTLTSGTP